MDIKFYKILKEGLQSFNENLKKPYGNEIVSVPTKNTTYPYTQFSEVLNVANRNYNSPFERVASVGYRVDIFAKDQGSKYQKMDIAREIAEMVDFYLSRQNLYRESFNVIELENDSSIYHIIMMYSGNLREYRRKLI